MTIESTSIENQEKEPNPEGAPVVYTSDPVPTPAFILSYYLQKRLGNVREDCQLVPSLSVSRDRVSAEFISISTSQPGMRERMVESVDKLSEAQDLSGSEKKKLMRMVNYVDHTRWDFMRSTKIVSPLQSLMRIGASTVFYDLLVDVSLHHPQDPKEAIEAGVQVVDHFLHNGHDPFKFGKGETEDSDYTQQRIKRLIELKNIKSEQVQRYKESVEHGRKVKIELPIFRVGEDGRRRFGETHIEEIMAVERGLERLRILEGENVGLVIVGPPHSGKSTMTASLTRELNQLLTKTKQDYRYADLRVGCSYVDLDKSTPGDTSRVIVGEDMAGREKHEWTNQLALEASTDFLQVSSNIKIADAPGGDPDHITEVVIGPADLGLLLIAEKEGEKWAQARDTWGDALNSVGVDIAVLARSRREGEVDHDTGQEVESSITTFRFIEGEGSGRDWIEYIGGRVTGLDLKLKKEDGFISPLAKVLLFDIFPQVVIKRREKAMRYYQSLLDVYLTHRIRVRRKANKDNQ